MKRYRCPICRRRLEVNRMKGICIELVEKMIYSVEIKCKKCGYRLGARLEGDPKKTTGKDEEIFDMLVKRLKRAVKEDYEYMWRPEDVKVEDG